MAEPRSVAGPLATWTVDQRLQFIRTRLLWEGRVNRADLVHQFGISPNQATNDLRVFNTLNPGLLTYDTRQKCYLAPKGLAPEPPDTVHLLRQLRLMAEGVAPGTSPLDWTPALEIADAPARHVDGQVLRGVLAAIKGRQALSATYRSFSSPRPSMRTIEPHALVFDGFRWHARARDVGAGRFKDFVLGRLSGLAVASPAGSDASNDFDWQTRDTLVIEANPRLTPEQRELVEIDYGMVDGQLVLTPRRAVTYYVTARLGLGPGHDLRAAQDQHIVLREFVPHAGH